MSNTLFSVTPHTQKDYELKSYELFVIVVIMIMDGNRAERGRGKEGGKEESFGEPAEYFVNLVYPWS